MRYEVKFLSVALQQLQAIPPRCPASIGCLYQELTFFHSE